MWTTDILLEEHRWILLLTRALERLVADARAQGRLDAQVTAELVALLQHFANGLHQEREERCLFPVLLARARSVAERMEVARLSGQHEEERRVLEALDRSLLGAIYGVPQSVRDFLEGAARAAALQREHVALENRDLMPLVEALLTPADDRAVVQAFARLETHGPQEVRAIFGRIEALCVRLGVAAGAPSP